MAPTESRERLEAAIAARRLLHPIDADTPGLLDLVHWLAAHDAAAPHAAAFGDAIGAPRHIVFVLVDGMGMHIIDRLPDDSFLRRHTLMELRTVFPSSTAPAITSLATGRWPGEHSVTGWWTYLPAAGVTATILPYVERFSGAPMQGTGARAEVSFPVPSALPALAADVAAFQPAPIANSFYSTYFAGGRPQHGYRRARSAIDAICARIESARNATFTYWYISAVDATEHTHGPASKEAWNALLAVERDLRDLHARLDGRARIIATADHGQMQIAPSGRAVFTAADDLMEMLEFPPSGEPRVPYFHVRSGQEGRFSEAFAERMGPDWLLLTPGDAEALRLFGPGAISAETHRRIGSFIGIALDRSVLLYKPSEDLLAMEGTHGGLLAEEMRIPLVIA